MKEHDSNPEVSLPDVSSWQPRAVASDTVRQAFYTRCSNIESILSIRAASERKMNIDNFDAGAGIEDLVREELGNLLPSRYAVRSGVLSDREGRTAGDCDVIIFNDFWFPAVKAGATAASRRAHLPVEGTYAVLEVKQSLSIKTLDEAMQKLVTSSRLYRPPTSSWRVTENRELGEPGCVRDVINPLYTAVIATDLAPGVELDDIAMRFIKLNQLVSRNEVVDCVCVLGQGYLTWVFRDNNGELRPARFREVDSSFPLMPVRISQPGRSNLYELLVSLLAHLFGSTLAAEDVAVHHGLTQGIQVANDESLYLLAGS